MALLILALLQRIFLMSSLRSEERFSRNAETYLVCRLLLEKKKILAFPTPFLDHTHVHFVTHQPADCHCDRATLPASTVYSPPDPTISRLALRCPPRCTRLL